MRIGITERGDAALSTTEWMDALKTGKVDAAIIITKDPSKLLNIKLPNNVIVHCTITGLGKTYWERNAPFPEDAVETYNKLVSLYGGERIVLRIDPIIPYGYWKKQAFEIIKHREGRVRISFIDMYDHVRLRYKDETGSNFNWWLGIHCPLQDRLDILNEMKKTGDIEVCGEPGISCTGCVSAKDMEIFGIHPSGELKGQREYCPCLSEKFELLSNRHPCANKCLYCYWKS